MCRRIPYLAASLCSTIICPGKSAGDIAAARPPRLEVDVTPYIGKGWPLQGMWYRLGFADFFSSALDAVAKHEVISGAAKSSSRDRPAKMKEMRG